jgi:hypothetical protein
MDGKCVQQVTVANIVVRSKIGKALEYDDGKRGSESLCPGEGDARFEVRVLTKEGAD